MSIIADKIEIRIDGKTYNDKYFFSDIHLIQEIQRPNEFRFLMHKNTLTENENEIRVSLSEELLGKKIEFSLNTLREDENGEIHDDVLEFSGIIFNINALRKNIKAGMVIEVIAYSPDYLLFDNPHCYSYENETLKSIVTKTLDPYKISVQNNPRMEDEIPYTVQYNETNYAFINRLAIRFGEWLYHNGKELVFGKIKKTKSIELYPVYDILNYQYRLDMEHLNFTCAHHNYLDYETPKNDAFSFTGQSMHSMTDIAYKQSKSLYSKKTFQHLQSSAPEGTFDETEHAAKVQGFGKKAQQMVCLGNTNRADLCIGSVIKIKEFFETENQKMSSCHHDELLIYKITHTTDSNGNYENEFTAIPASGEYPPYIYNDCYPKTESQRAVVMDNKDPEQLGRVRVQFLWQQEQDDSQMTPWIRIAQPHGGDNKGFYFIPEIDEEVMVGFENGNAEKPYVIGTLWYGKKDLGSKQSPKERWSQGDSNAVKGIRTRNGHAIVFYDNPDGKGCLLLYDAAHNSIVINADDDKIFIQSKGDIELHASKDIILSAGGNIINNAGENIESNAGGDIHTTAKVDIVSRAGGEIFMRADSNFEMQSGDKWLGFGSSLAQLQSLDGNVLVHGKSNVQLQSPGHIKLCETPEIWMTSDSAVQAKTANIELKANAELKAEASMVKIN